jgi:hypothetical protein
MMDLWWYLHAVLGAVLNVHEEINGLEQMVCYIIILIVKWKVL